MYWHKVRDRRQGVKPLRPSEILYNLCGRYLLAHLILVKT